MNSRAIAAVLLCAAAAHGEGGFGARGQLAPFGGIGYSHSAGNGISSDSVSLAPGALWFAVDGIALGLSAIFAHRSSSAQLPFFLQPVASSTTSFGGAPMAAAAFPLTERVAFFPQLEVNYLWQRVSGGGISQTSHSISLQGFAPLLFIPAPHFFLGFGPFLSWNVEGAGSGNFALGLNSQIGGYF
jgi:hypothetical protein